MTALLTATLVIYLAAIFALGVYASRRVKSESDYLVAGRRLPLSLAWATLLATWFGAATLLGAAEAARVEGVRGTVLDPFASGGALILAGLIFARPLWKMKLFTMADFYARRFGPRAELLASLILVPGYFGWIAAQYVALAGLQRTFFGIDLGVGIVIAAAIVLAYTLVGGMWSVTMTDALQMSVVLITILILAASAFGHLGGGSVVSGLGRLFAETPPDMLTILPEAGAVAGIAWVATWGSGLLGNIPGQDLMQRVFASKDERTAMRACVLAGIIYLAFGLIPVGLGLASSILVPSGEGGDILAILASQFLSPALTVVFVVSLVSIIVSTCTSAVLSPAAIVGHNVLSRSARFRARPLTADRLSVLLVTVASVFVAFSGRTILELLELSLSTILVGLFVPLVAGLFGSMRSERAALFAMGLGIAVWLARELFEAVLAPVPPSLAAAGVSFPGHISATYSSERVGALLSWLLYAFAFLPSAISGTLASLIGYLLGWRMSKKPMEEARLIEPI